MHVTMFLYEAKFYIVIKFIGLRGGGNYGIFSQIPQYFTDIFQKVKSPTFH